MEADPKPPEERVLSPRFAMLLLAQGLFGLCFSTYFLIPKYLQVELDADPTTIGWVSGIAWTTSVLCVPITGTLVDRLGRRRFLFSGALAMIVGCCLFAIADEVGPLMLGARVLQGLGFSFFFVAASTLATDLAPPSRLSQAIGWFGATMVATNALSPAIAEPLAYRYGWDTVFWGTAVFAAASAVVASRLAAPTHRVEASATPFREVLGIAHLRPVWLVSALAGLLFGACITFASPWALDSGFENVGVFFISYACASSGVRLIAGGLADRVGRLPVAIGAMTVYGLAPLFVMEVARVGLVLPGLLLGGAQGMYYPALNALAVEWSSARVRATVMALYNGAFNVGFTMGSMGLGPVAASFGYPPMFAFAASASVVAIVVMLRMHRRPQPA